MGLRNKFQIEISKLKNIIRKMKVELESYGKQLRLNIDGMKDQANSFSMSIIGSFEQEKVKKAFYEEETRKLKQIIQLKETELETTIDQCKEKVNFYSERLQSYKQRLKEDEITYSEQEQRHTRDLDSQKSAYLREIEENNDHFQKEIQHLENVIREQK